MALEVNGVAVNFYPQDASYLDGLAALACDLDGMQERLLRAQKKLRRKDTQAARIKLYDLDQGCNAAMREKLDAFFGEGVCAAIFEGKSVHWDASGVPMWFNLIEGVYNSLDARLRPKGCGGVLMKYRTRRAARKQRQKPERREGEDECFNRR